jgi:hypothetical protein
VLGQLTTEEFVFQIRMVNQLFEITYINFPHSRGTVCFCVVVDCSEAVRGRLCNISVYARSNEVKSIMLIHIISTKTSIKVISYVYSIKELPVRFHVGGQSKAMIRGSWSRVLTEISSLGPTAPCSSAPLCLSALPGRLIFAIKIRLFFIV